MTKGRTENNRAWEKERRDRLNRSFDVLAKFLPNYDDSVPYSKIEIIQKSILLIKDLQHKLKELLAQNHKDILNTILELEEAFKVLIVRNKVLLALLKKCGGTAPPFTEPKIFNYIVTNPLEESDLNELYVKQNGRPPKNAKARTKKKLQTLHDDEEVLQKKKKNKSNKKDEKKKSKNLEVSNENTPDTVQNSVLEQKDESTKIKDIKSIDDLTDTPPSAIPKDNLEIKHKATPVVATGILLPISNLKKPMNLDSGPIIVVNALPKTSTIMPKPLAQKEIAGKIAILPLKSKTVPRKQRVRRTKKEIEQERKSSLESKLLTLQKNDVDDAVIDSEDNKCDEDQTEQNIMTNDAPQEIDLSKPQDSQPDSNRIETTEPTLPQHELSNDILASLQIPQNESNNESMSPTAAFLMSFPVVSSAGVRIGEDEHETHDSQSLQQPLSSSKPANEPCILDNISSLLTTKDYERFVEDAVKNDATQGNEKGAKSSQTDSGNEKRVAMSFDFQLKPIMNSCAEVKTGTEDGTKTSVTCSSTYLPEIGNLSYKSTPIKKHRKSINEENFSGIGNVSITQENLLPLTTPNRISPVQTDDYIRSHSGMDFITSSSTILHNLEPPTKMLKLSDGNEHVKKTESTSFENLFIKSSSVSTVCNSLAPSNTFSSIYTYSYDKAAYTISKSEPKASAKENVDFNSIPSIPASACRVVDSSLLKLSKVSDKQKDRPSFPQPFNVNTTNTSGTTISMAPCSGNQFNSLYSYPNSTITYSSTTIPHLSTNTVASSSNVKTFQDTSPKSTAPTSIDKTFFKTNHSTASATDGFYTSLTSIGTTHSNLPQYPSSIMRPNMYTSALSLSSSSNQKPLDYAPQTPFTFSLTTPLNTVSKSTTLTSCQQSQNYLPTTHSTSYAQDYNPFAFENISSISAPITPYSACRETSQFSFSLTSTTNKVTTKNSSQSSFSIDNNFLTDTRLKSITPMKPEAPSERKLSYKQCSKGDVAQPEDVKNKETTQKVEKSGAKQHVNWMTSSTDLQKNEYPIIPPLDYTQPASLPNHYLSQANSQLSNLNSQKNTDLYFAHAIGDENFQWSPNKIIDTPNINSTTLPNLHGDLALNSITPKPQVSVQDKSKNSKLMTPSHMHPQQNVTANPSNTYFSVSQLVDHPKPVGQSKSYEDAVLQQKATKASSSHSRFKHKDSKKVVKSSSNVSNFTPNIFVESFAYNEPLKQNNSNNYSAEALISIHPSKKETKTHSNSFNQSEYCESYNNMDYLNESNYNYYNNSYFPQIPDNEYFCSGSYSDQQFHSKSSRASIPSTKSLSTIGDTSYGSHASQNNLYTFPHPSGKLCQQSSQYKNSPQLSTTYNQSRSYSNSNKKQFKQDLFPSSYDPNSSANYFTPSLNINTPMLPHPPLIPTPHNIPSNDDFNYTPHLNYPTGLSKTTTYPATQQISDNNNQSNLMLHGNVGGGNAGNLVTNFNLSTICPEINDKTRQQNW